MNLLANFILFLEYPKIKRSTLRCSFCCMLTDGIRYLVHYFESVGFVAVDYADDVHSVSFGVE